MLPVAILAGGLATRLLPITEAIPKAMVAVADRPFLFYQLRWLESQGCRRVVLCVGHLGEMIEKEFGDGKDRGMDIRYSYDGPKLLGTGGALRKALPLLGEAFFVLYGDSYLPIQYRDVEKTWEASHEPALMTVFANRNAWDASNVEFESGKIVRYDKNDRSPQMRHIDYGLNIFSASLLKSNPTDEPFDLAELQRELVVRGQMAGHEVGQRFYEIGSHEGLAELDALLRTQTFLQ